METSADAAGWLLVVALPVSIWVAWSDMARMKIPNAAVLTLLAGFAVIGLLVFEPATYGARWLHTAAMLAVGMIANAMRIMGAGDAKFIAAAAPYVALGDLGSLLWLLALASVFGYLAHLLARRSIGPRLAPGWASWSSGKRFPMGLPLALALVAYLGLAASA